MRSQRFTVLTAVLLTLVSTNAFAAVTAGFIEKWPTTTSGWSGSGLITYSNPFNGGADDDGFLQMSLASPGHFGTRSPTGAEYSGDWIAAGITQIKVKLNDLASNNNLNIHVSVGSQANLWQYNIGFVPAVDTWTQFAVDLTDSTLFTRIVGFGTFSSALRNGDLIHIRNDLPPFSQTPDNASGDMGIDDLELVGTPTGVGDIPRSGIVPIDLAAPSPNPSRGPVALSMRASEDSPIQVRILDVLGREIRHQTLSGAAGMRIWVWDGRDAQGNMAPAGVYRAIATSKAGGTSRSLVRIQ